MGNILRHGVDLYKQTVNLKNQPKSPTQDAPLPDYRKIAESGGRGSKTGKSGSGGGKPQSGSEESKYRRVAKFLILMGANRRREFSRNLTPNRLRKYPKKLPGQK